MRRYSCNLCDWNGDPHPFLKDVVDPVHYAVALGHIKKEHPEYRFSIGSELPLTIQVWEEKVQSLHRKVKKNGN